MPPDGVSILARQASPSRLQPWRASTHQLNAPILYMLTAGQLSADESERHLVACAVPARNRHLVTELTAIVHLTPHSAPQDASRVGSTQMDITRSRSGANVARDRTRPELDSSAHIKATSPGRPCWQPRRHGNRLAIFCRRHLCREHCSCSGMGTLSPIP